MTEREAFMRWLSVNKPWLDTTQEGERFAHIPVELMADAWHASRKQALRQAYDAMFDVKGDKVTRFDAQAAIRSLSTPDTEGGKGC